MTVPSKSTRQSHTAQQRATLASREKESALKRLREAEARLREAIEDLHTTHAPKEDWYSCFFSSRHPLCQHYDSCIANSIGSLCQSFLLAYGVRVGIGVLLRAFKLAKNKSYHSLLDLKVRVLHNFWAYQGTIFVFLFVFFLLFWLIKHDDMSF